MSQLEMPLLIETGSPEVPRRAVDVDPRLLPYLDNLAVVRHDYTDIQRRLGPNSNFALGDELGKGLVTRLFDVDYESAANHSQKDTFEQNVFAIDEAVRQQPPENDGGIIWPKLIEQFLAIPVTTQELLAAFTCSLLANDETVRTDFLRSIHRLGAGNDLGAALETSYCLSYIINPASPDRKCTRFTLYSRAFTAPAEDAEYYIAYRQNSQIPPEQPAKAKLRQRQLYESLRNGEDDEELFAAAQANSRAPHDMQDSSFDPHKIERFAIQQMYIQDQLAVLFPDENLQSSPYAKALTQSRLRADFHSAIGLRNDMRSVIGSLSQPVTALYSLDNVTGMEPLTDRQMASARFADLGTRSTNYEMIGRYLNYDGDNRYPRIQQPWAIPESGAAVADQTAVYITHVRQEAARHAKATGTIPTQDTLFKFALENRKHIIRLSLVNIDDFRVATEQRGLLEPRPVPYAALEVTTQPATDELDLQIPLAEKALKNIADTYRGATLGCVAGRVAMDALHHSQERGLQATNNLIDYILEVSLHEAHQRGLFDIRDYVAGKE